MSDVRWAQLAASAFRLERGERGVRDELTHLLELFGPELDPVDAFEASVVRRWLLALQRAQSASAS